MPNKPLAVRILEQRKVPHEVFEFDAAIRSADGVAQHTGIDPALVYKTLVVEHDPPKGKPCLVLMPSTTELDLKLLAAAIGAKKLRMATHRDAERVTGLQVGGISALALLNRGFAVYIERAVLAHDSILVSAGQRGCDVKLRVEDLLSITSATPIAAAKE